MHGLDLPRHLALGPWTIGPRLGLPGGPRLRMLHLGSERYAHGAGAGYRRLQPHAHAVWHLVVIVAGRNTCIHDGMPRAISAGDRLLANPGAWHEYRPRDETPLDYVQLTFDLDPMPARLPTWTTLMAVLDPEAPRLSDVGQTDPTAVASALAALAAARNMHDAHQAIRALWQLWSILRPTPLTPHWLARVRHHLASGGGDLRQLAKQAGVSPEHLSRVFHRVYGQTPRTYRLHCRVMQAQELLTDSNRSLAEIADAVGFSDAFYFSRAMKQVTGLSPSVWRRQQR